MLASPETTGRTTIVAETGHNRRIEECRRDRCSNRVRAAAMVEAGGVAPSARLISPQFGMALTQNGHMDPDVSCGLRFSCTGKGGGSYWICPLRSGVMRRTATRRFACSGASVGTFRYCSP